MLVQLFALQNACISEADQSLVSGSVTVAMAKTNAHRKCSLSFYVNASCPDSLRSRNKIRFHNSPIQRCQQGVRKEALRQHCLSPSESLQLFAGDEKKV